MDSQSLPVDMLLAYKRYKHNTGKVVGWLAENAVKAGYKSESCTTVFKEPKLKGRARKLARDAAKAGGPYRQSRKTCVVKVSDIVEMAKCIVKIRPKVVMSRELREIWERTIRMRREFGQWFRAKSNSDAAINEKHSYFASVLECALETLKPCYQEGPKGTPTSGQKKSCTSMTPFQDVNNMFQHLEVEDTLSDEEFESRSTKPEGNTSRNAVDSTRLTEIDFDDDEVEAEFLFAVWSFLHDVMAVRISVESTWELYARGKIELMQAANVTNLAVDMIRQAEAEFESNLKRPAKYPASKYPTGSLPFLIFKLHLPDEYDGRLSLDPDVPMGLVICGCEICDFLLYVPWAMAKLYVHLLKTSPPVLPTSDNNFYAQAPRFCQSRTFNSQYYDAENPSQKAETGLRKILPESSVLSLSLRGSFFEDEILHAARHILENRNVPLWVSFALQLQLDIQQLRGFKSFCALSDLHRAYQVTEERWEDHRKWHESLEFELGDCNDKDQLHPYFKRFNLWIEVLKDDKSSGDGPLQRVLTEQTVRSAVNTSTRLTLLERFPVTCGTIKTELQLQWHMLGLTLVNNAGHVLALCHLYNALHLLGPNAPIWPDMELLIRNQGPGKIFIGSRPKTLVQARSRLLLSLGFSPSSFAKDSKCYHISYENAIKRRWELSPISQILFDRCPGTESRKIDEAAYQLQQLLYSRKYWQDLEQNLFAASKTDEEMTQVTSKGIPLQTKMVRTLINLSQAFDAEMPAFMFDYLSMQRRCFEIFVQLTKDVQEMMSAGLYDTSHLESRNNDPMPTTWSIFSLSVGTENTVQAITSKNRAWNRANGPSMARNIRSMLPKTKDKKKQAKIDKMLKLTTEGRSGEVLQEIMDVSENASALRIFRPVQVAVSGLVEAGAGDVELRKLRKLVGNTGYGVFAFRHRSLDALYGSGRSDMWEDIGIPETEIEDTMFYQADNPVLYLVAAMNLHQQEVTCGEGEDSHDQSGYESTNIPRWEVDSKGGGLKGEGDSFNDSGFEEKEDWKALGEIYGKEGQMALR